MQDRGHKVEKLEYGFDSVMITLQNGVQVTLTSNPNYLHLSVSGIGCNTIDVAERAANYVNIKYNKPE